MEVFLEPVLLFLDKKKTDIEDFESFLSKTSFHNLKNVIYVSPKSPKISKYNGYRSAEANLGLPQHPRWSTL